jgi:hypothetical protein
MGSVRGEGDGGRIEVQKLQEQLAKLTATLAGCIVLLDNRIERLEGRAGVPVDQLITMLSEFKFGTDGR